MGIPNVRSFNLLQSVHANRHWTSYLPPPVLEILDNKHIEGAKRAALLTTALKYVLDRVPMVMIPPPARPAMTMFKAFTPYLGYVGGFVAWSWGAVKSFDKGLSCTAFSVLACGLTSELRQRCDADRDLASNCRSHTWYLGGQ